MLAAGTPKAHIRKDPVLRRGEILDEAVRLIGRLGFHGVTVRGLALSCNMTNAGLLHYFPTKTHLFASVVDHLEQRQTDALRKDIERLEESRHAGLLCVGQVRALLDNMVRTLLADRELAQLISVIQAEALDDAHPAHDACSSRERAAIAFVSDLLTGLVEAPETIARALHGAANGLVLQWLRDADATAAWCAWDMIATCLLQPPRHEADRACPPSNAAHQSKHIRKGTG